MKWTNKTLKESLAVDQNHVNMFDTLISTDTFISMYNL